MSITSAWIHAIHIIPTKLLVELKRQWRKQKRFIWIWTVFSLFAVLCLWLFIGARRKRFLLVLQSIDRYRYPMLLLNYTDLVFSPFVMIIGIGCCCCCGSVCVYLFSVSFWNIAQRISKSMKFQFLQYRYIRSIKFMYGIWTSFATNEWKVSAHSKR